MAILNFKKKKKTEENQKTLHAIAFVILEEDKMPSWKSIEKMLKKYFKFRQKITDVKEEDNKILVKIDDCIIAIAKNSETIPWPDLEGPCRSAWYWPEAVNQMQKQKAHLIITLMSKDMDRIDLNILLTKFVAGTAFASEALGIYWAAGALVNSNEIFMGFNEGISRKFLPLYNWIDFRVNQNEDATLTLFTTGLKQFDLMEIEVINSNLSPKDLITRVFNIAHYLLENGPVLKDGDTLSMTKTEKVKIQFEPSILDKNITVYRLYI